MARKRSPPPENPTPTPPPVAPADVPLTPSERAFVDEYLVDLNGTRAYRAAFPGCTYGAARVGASRLVAKPNIVKEIRAARAVQSRRTRLDASRVLRDLCRVAFSDVVDLVDDAGALCPLHHVPLEVRRAIASVRVRQERVTSRTTKKGKTRTTTTTHERVVEYRLWDKLGAMEKLCRYLGLHTEILPLEALFLALPRPLAAQIRAAMLEARRAAPGGDRPLGSDAGGPVASLAAGGSMGGERASGQSDQH